MKRILIIVSAAAGLLVVLLWFCLAALPDGKLRMWILDVGQGDAILIQTPERQYILIDGGADGKTLEQLSQHLPFFVRTLDLVILSHPHADHLVGLLPLFERYKVGKLLITGVDYKSNAHDALWREIYDREIPFLMVRAGEDYRLGSLFLDIVYPFSSLQGQTFSNVNNSSLVFRLIFGEQIFLFTGDLEAEKEHVLVQEDLNLRADFLKVGHHGSKTSSTEAFLNAVQPAVAFISCGVNNPFHHPFPATVERFLKRKTTLYRTDLDGTIAITLDGPNSNIITEGKL